jgi:hypothetical protein
MLSRSQVASKMLLFLQFLIFIYFMDASTFALVHLFIIVFTDPRTLATRQLAYSGWASSWDTFPLISSNGCYETRYR